MIVVSSSALIAAGRSQMTFYLILPIVISAFAAHFMLVPRFGPIGAAGVTTGLSWIGAFCCMLAVCRVWKVRLPITTFIRSITICVLAYVLASKWETPGLLVLLKLFLISIIIIIANTLLGEFRGDKITFVRSIFDRLPSMNQNKGKFK
jgi:O-antigen/teichoic acid export membrane protein